MRILVLLVLVAACGSSSSSSGADAAPAATPVIPAPTGTCPTITNGDVMFAPAGIPPRMVNIAMNPAKTGGPLILYWYATGSNPNEAGYALGATEQQILGAGGLVATPYADPTAGQFEWFIVNMSPKLDDFILADEIVACLAAAHRIDTTHIHSMGMSAGALQTSALHALPSSVHVCRVRGA